MAVIRVNVRPDTKVMALHVSTSTNAPPELTIVMPTPLAQTSAVLLHVAATLATSETVKTALISMNVPPIITTVIPMQPVPTRMVASLVAAITDTPEMA